jgi:hypothetical protein
MTTSPGRPTAQAQVIRVVMMVAAKVGEEARREREARFVCIFRAPASRLHRPDWQRSGAQLIGVGKVRLGA